MMDITEKKDSFQAHFKQLESSDSASWVQPLRAAAMARFNELGFPTRHHEEWRFTNVAPIVETPFILADTKLDAISADALAKFTFDGLGGVQLVFVNGHYCAEHSSIGALPDGIKIGSLADAIQSDQALVEPHLAKYAQFDQQTFVALNTAMLQDGAFISIPKNVVMDEPIHLLFAANTSKQATVSHPRVLIIAGENSQCQIIESYAGPADQVYFTNAVTEVYAAPNSVIDHYKLQRESKSAYHVSTMQIQLDRDVNFTSHAITLGGSLARNDVNAVLADSGIECTLNGLYTANDRQLMDNHTSIDHAMPHCNSHEVYKGILDGKARGVFNGKIFVRQDAQKTDAKQTNQTLLLSDDAQITTKPQLEIFADDVKCTHGATVGQLNEEALFYLRARGIGKDEARNLLVYAFASDIINRIKVEPIRAHLDHTLLAERALEGIE